MMISGEAPLMLAKASELFIAELTVRAGSFAGEVTFLCVLRSATRRVSGHSSC